MIFRLLLQSVKLATLLHSDPYIICIYRKNNFPLRTVTDYYTSVVRLPVYITSLPLSCVLTNVQYMMHTCMHMYMYGQPSSYRHTPYITDPS